MGPDLTERLRARLSVLGRDRITVRTGPPSPQPPEPVDGVEVAVVVLVQVTAADLQALGEQARRGGPPLLPVRHDGAVTLVGPVLGAGLAGCAGCAEETRAGLRDAEPPALPGGSPVPAAVVTLAAMIGVIADALPLSATPAHAGTAGAGPAEVPGDDAAGRLWMLHGDGTVSVHGIVPRPSCPFCSSHPSGSARAAGPSGADGPPTDGAGAGALRRPNPAVAGDRLRTALVDVRMGPVLQVRHSDDLPVAMASAEIAVDGRRDWGYGRAVTPGQAERIALFEAVERRLAMSAHGGRAARRASFAQLGPDRAVDPRRLGLPDPAFDHHPASRLTPYAPDLPTTWVDARSLTRDRPTAVPEHVGYYATTASARAPHFVEETSNGCGLGASLAEAALFGLFEVIERDAFLMAWYAGTPLRRLAVPDDDLTAHLVDRLAESGYELLLFDATTDLPVPAVLSLAVRRDHGRAATGSRPLPQAYFSAGAHLDPRQAVRSAAQEAAVGLVATARLAAQDPRRADTDRLLPMLDDPTLVRTIDDHVALNALPQARPRYAFLLDGAQAADPVPLTQAWPDRRPDPRTGPEAALPELVDRLGDAGLETLVVDQTEPWTRDRLGLHAAKVIVPGTLPMTFGHVHRRTLGLPRLLTVPHRLGRAAAPLVHDDLPLHPHPFP